MPKGYDITELSDSFLCDLGEFLKLSSRISSYSIHIHGTDNDNYNLVHWLALSLQAIKKELSYQTDGTWKKVVLAKLHEEERGICICKNCTTGRGKCKYKEESR